MARGKNSKDKSRMYISFSEADEDLYDFLKETKNASVFIRKLLRGYLNGKLPSIEKLKETEEEIVKELPEEEEHSLEEKANRKALKNKFRDIGL